MNADPLVTTLIDLSRAMGDQGFRLILGGGFGLYLKQVHLQSETNLRTYLRGDVWSAARATEDLDLFLPTELVVSLEEMKSLRAAIDAIGFVPVEKAKFFHFQKPWIGGGRVKIDMLTGPLTGGVSAEQVKYVVPRIRPRGDVQLHAYVTPEALDFEESLLPIELSGVGSDGRPAKLTVYVPQAFTFILMKLHAVADRLEDADADLGRHHALDVYRLIAMLTEQEYDQVRRNVLKHEPSQPIIRSREIVRTYFSAPDALGILRLREHSLFDRKMDVGKLIDALRDLFQ